MSEALGIPLFVAVVAALDVLPSFVFVVVVAFGLAAVAVVLLLDAEAEEVAFGLDFGAGGV